MLKKGDKVKIINTRTPRVKQDQEATVTEVRKLPPAYGFNSEDRLEIEVSYKDGGGWYYPSDLEIIN